MTAVDAAGAGYAYLEALLLDAARGGARGALYGSGGTEPWRARAIFRGAIDPRQQQQRRAPMPCILLAALGGRDSYTLGERPARGHWSRLRYAVRAVDQAREADRAEALAARIDERLNPGPDGDIAGAPGYRAVLCIREESLRGYEADPAQPEEARALRWLVGGVYLVVVEGDAAP